MIRTRRIAALALETQPVVVIAARIDTLVDRQQIDIALALPRHFDAMQFIGWYHRESATKVNIPLNDPYKLYLAYHSGHTGYLRGAYNKRPEALRGAKRFTDITYTYAKQLQQCPG